MCGLVGIYSSNMQTKHKEALAALLYLDTWRGRDSTGVAAIRANTDTVVIKSTVPGYEFVEGPLLDQTLKLNDFCWIGHNRFGTVGKNIKSNAHPFMIDDKDGGCILVGAHNGTLKYKSVLTDHAQYGTDSEAMLASIAFEGLEQTVAKLEGAWAVTYYDHIEEELRIFRNKERPLFYAFEKDKHTFLWASESWMLRVVCGRFNIELEDDKVWALNEDTLYSLPVPLKINEELRLERKGGLVGKAPTFFQPPKTTSGASAGTTRTTGPVTGDYSRSGQTGSPLLLPSNTPSGTKKEKAGGKQQKAKGSSSTEPLKLPDSITDRLNRANANNVRDILSARNFKGFGGEALTKKELDDQLQDGCAWCELEFIDPRERFAWLAKGKPICAKCIDGVEHVEEVKSKNGVN